MTKKKMERIARGRRRAQGIGALAGTVTVFGILGKVYGKEMKEEAVKIAGEIKNKLPEPARNVIIVVKGKLGV